ncbi:VOC family protein, partial [Enterobacter hormaechei]|nr:VOC family protein [Enterobacter hormaechei]
CNGDAQESAEFYCQVFGGKITVDTPVVINIDLFGQKVMLLDGGSQFEKNPSISFLINCASEEDVQRYWDMLSDGGTALMALDSYPWSKKYGWIKDKYGATWQLYFG